MLIVDTFIQKTKKLYMDTKSQRNLNKISSDLKDIERLMTKNIQDILGRGAKIDGTHTPLLFQGSLHVFVIH